MLAPVLGGRNGVVNKTVFILKKIVGEERLDR